jgi:hypothetical protein
VGRSCSVSDGGPRSRANVGISNEKGSENLPRRKTKGFRATAVTPELVGA